MSSADQEVEMFASQMEHMANGRGFIAALD